MFSNSVPLHFWPQLGTLRERKNAQKKTQKSFPNCFLSEAKCAVQGDERNQVHMRIAINEQWLLELAIFHSI